MRHIKELHRLSTMPRVLCTELFRHSGGWIEPLQPTTFQTDGATAYFGPGMAFPDKEPSGGVSISFGGGVDIAEIIRGFIGKDLEVETGADGTTRITKVYV
jgi:hypothetical protein